MEGGNDTVLKQFFERIFGCRHMIPAGQVIGSLPPSREIYQNTFCMAWPAALEAVLISLIGSLDTIMVGKLGTAAIAAVGITNQPKFIMLSFIFSLNVGVTAIVARRKGQKDPEGAQRCLCQALILSAILSLLLTVVSVFFAEPIIRFAGADEEFLEEAVIYFRIIMVGLFFTAINLTINAAQRGSGNTKISMRTNLTANVVNLIFNFLLIEGNFGFPRLEIAGAAIATTLGNFVAFCMAIASILSRKGYFHINRDTNWRLDRKTISGITNIASSAMVEQVCLRVGFFLYARIVADLGTVAFATHQICMNIINISFCFGDGLSTAASALVGQSLGAERRDLAIVYGKTGQRMSFVVSTGLFFIFMFGGKYLVALFDQTPDVVNLGTIIMIVVAFTTHLQTSQVVISGCLRGAGDTKFVAASSLISTGILRPFSAWLLCYPLGFGLVGAWLSLLIDQLLRFSLNFFRFNTGKWTRHKI